MFVNAFVLGHNADGTIHLDVKPQANPAFVVIPSLRTPAHVRAEVAKAKAEMQAKKAAQKAAAKAAQGAVPDEEGEVHTPADAPDVDLEFDGARVIRWDWDPEGPCWEVLLDRGGEVLTRMVWPKDWPYEDPPPADEVLHESSWHDDSELRVQHTGQNRGREAHRFRNRR